MTVTADSLVRNFHILPIDVPEVEIGDFAYGSYLVNHAHVLVNITQIFLAEGVGTNFSTYFDSEILQLVALSWMTNDYHVCLVLVKLQIVFLHPGCNVCYTFLEPRANLIAHLLKNFRPISNLSFLSKVMEKVVTKQLIEHKETYNVREKMQSTFRRFHSTEIALVRIHNNWLLTLDKKTVCFDGLV